MADKKVRIIITGKDDTKKALRSVASGFKNVGKQLLGLGAKLTAGITLPLVGMATVAARAAIDYESAFAGVIKTTDGLIDAQGELTEAGKELNAGFRDLAKEIPLAASELAGIGEIAGQLGVPQEDILEFTRVIADIGVTTNLTLEGAAADFARFANIVGLPIDDIDRLGSTVVELGNNLATTESELVDMAMRIAGVGSVVGLTEPQILGWAGAMSSVGIRAEAGGTAISRVFADIAAAVAEGGDGIAGFAETAGLSIDEFSKLFEVDASAAMLAFVEGLGDIQDEGGNVLGILEDLDLDSVRVRDTLLRLAGAGPLVADALGIAGKGWEENIALTKEAEQRYATTESRLAILKNTLVDLGITFGEIILPILQDLVAFIGPVIARFSEMDVEGQKLILMGGLLLAAIGPIVTIAGILATVIGALASPIGLVVVGIAALVALFVESQGGIQGAADALGEIWQRVVDFVSVIGTELQPIIQDFRDIWEMVWPRIQEIVHNVLGDIVPFVMTKLGEMRDFITGVVTLITTWWQANFPLIQETVETVLNFIQTAWETVWPILETALDTVWENIKTIVETAINAVLGIIETIMLMITGDWEGAWETIKGVISTIWDGIKEIIETTLNNVLGLLGTNLDDMLTAITDKIDSFIQGGKDIVQGIVDGIKAAPGKIKDALLEIVQKAWQEVLEFFGITSPSTLFAEIGIEVMQGLAEGLDEGEVEVLTSVARMITAISNSFTSMARAIAGLGAEDPFAEGGFEEAMDLYFARMRAMGIRAMDWMHDISETHRELLADAVPVAENIKKLFSILGVDLAKIIPVDTADFEGAVDRYFMQMRFVGARIMDWIRSISDEYRDMLAEAAPVAENIKKLFAIIGIDLSKVVKLDTNFADLIQGYFAGLEQATDVAMEIIQRIKDKWGEALATAAETMQSIAAIWMGLADVTKAIDEAAALGGPDVAAANAMAGMMNDIMAGRPGQVGGAAGRLPGMGGVSELTLNITGEITVDIPGVGAFPSGEISERVTVEEGGLVDLRISFASASVGA